MKRRNIIYLVISFLIVFSFSFRIGYRVKYFVHSAPFVYILSFLGIYKLLSSREDKKINPFYLIMGLLISIITIFAYYVDNYDTIRLAFKGIRQCIKTIFMFIGYSYVFYYLIDYLFKGLSKIKYKKNKNKIIKFIFDDHPFISSFIILLICYIPIMFIFYPGVLMDDGVDVIRQFFCYDSATSNHLNLVDPNVCINTHHSPLYACVLGIIYKIFNSIGHPTLGIFMITFLQVILQIIIISYTIKLLKKLNINYIVRIVILLLFVFLPIFNINSVGIYKDIIFSTLCLLLTDYLIEYIFLKENNNKKIIGILIVSFLLTLLSNKGFYMVGLLAVSLIIFNYKKIKAKSLVFIIPVVLYLIYNSLLLPALHVTKVNIREAIAVPLQQVSRYVVYYGDEVTDEEKEAINGLIEFDKISEKYDRDLADGIKDSIFNKNYTDEDLNKFIKVYFKLFFKHPGVYVNAYLNMTSGFFDFYRFNGVTYMDVSSWKGDIISDGQFQFPRLVSYTKAIVLSSRFVPILGLLYNLALYSWLVVILVTYLILRKKWKYIIPFIPSIVIFLFLFVSPANGNKRYVYPIMYCMMILIPFMISLFNKKEVK